MRRTFVPPSYPVWLSGSDKRCVGMRACEPVRHSNHFEREHTRSKADLAMRLLLRNANVVVVGGGSSGKRGVDMDNVRT